jgi:hypothetical protein
VAALSNLERRQRVISLKLEAEAKLAKSWRGKATETLLHGDPTQISVEAIREALYHLNSASQNGYRKLGLLKAQLTVVGLILIALVTSAVIAALRGMIPGITQGDEANTFVSAVFSGLLGGTLSAALSSSRVATRTKIPDVQRSSLILLARTFIGAAAAIPTFAMLRGNLVPVDAREPFALMLFCFLSGFSERWFLDRLNTAGSKEDAADSSKS